MTAREHALNILLQFWETNDRLKTVTDSYFNNHTISGQERQRIIVQTRDVIRYMYRLDTWIEVASSRPIKKIKPIILTILEMATYEITMDDHIPDHAAINSAVELAGKRTGAYAKGFVNGVLRSITRLDKRDVFPTVNSNEYLSLWYSYPDWMVKRWKKQFDTDEIYNVLEEGNRHPHMSIRLNPNRLTAHKFETWCQSNGIDISKTEYSEHFYTITKNAGKIFSFSGFHEGVISIQDRGAGILVELLDPQPGDTILDVCAAPGTKSLYIAEKLSGKGYVYSSDVDESRMNLGMKDMDRHGNKLIEWRVADASRDEFPMVDKILIDAPCSGTGVIRRRPDIKWRREEGELTEYVSTQIGILSNMSQYVKSGGTIVYGTCSMEPEENMEVVKLFLTRFPDFSIDPHIPDTLHLWKNDDGAIETFSHKHALDGMFGIRLKKHG